MQKKQNVFFLRKVEKWLIVFSVKKILVFSYSKKLRLNLYVYKIGIHYINPQKYKKS